MSAQPKFNIGRIEADGPVSPRMAIAHQPAAANAVHLMQQDVQDRLASETRPQRRAGGVPLHALVTVPGVVVGAACVLPLAVAAFGVSRIARGRMRGLGADTASTARAMWQATGATIDVLTNRSSRR